MKNSFKLVLQILLVIALGGGSFFLALEMMDNLYTYRSPLSSDPPIPGQSFGKPVSERVVLVIVDALRYDTSMDAEVMPILNQMRVQGASAMMHSQVPSYSSPGYSTLLTGAWPYLNDGPVFNIDYEEIKPFSQDNVFSSAKRFGLKTAASGYNWFEKLIPSSALDIGYFTPLEDQSADRVVVDAAIPWLASDDYNLILIHLDQVDYAGHHEGGPKSENWQKAATRVDGLLAEIISELDFSKDTLIITADHGQIDQGGHGGQDDVTLVEPFVLVGKGVKSGAYEDVQMVDVAPTISAFLGINLPASTQGQVLTEMILLPQSTREGLKVETSRQQSQLLADYATAIGQTLPEEATNASPSISVEQYQGELINLQKNRLNQERLIRFGISALVIIILLIILSRWKPKSWRKFTLAAILYSVLFHATYLTLGSKVYSYSVVDSPVQLVLSNGIISVSALAITWLLFSFQDWIAIDLKQNLIKVLNLSIFIMLVTALPLIAHIVWDGLFASWILPDLRLHYLALLSMTQTFSMAIGVVLLMIITTIILISRKRKPA